MKPLIKALEVWAPDADDQLLVLSNGLYGTAKSFGAQSRSMCFGRGEGLPGLAWEEQRPILLTNLQGGRFRRAEFARKAGLTCAVALPFFAGEQLQAIVLFLCGADLDASGAIELWHRESDSQGDMSLVDGYYGAHGRVPAAADATYVVTIPARVPGIGAFAITLRATGPAALAAAVESWMPDSAGRVRRTRPQDSGQAGQRPAEPTLIDVAAPPVVLDAFESAAPVITPRGHGEAAAGSVAESGMLALPIIRAGSVQEVLAIFL